MSDYDEYLKHLAGVEACCVPKIIFDPADDSAPMNWINPRSDAYWEWLNRVHKFSEEVVSMVSSIELKERADMTEDEQKYQTLKANYEKLQRKANMNACEEKRLAAKIDYYERRIASGELVERKHGHWIEDYDEWGGYRCSECNEFNADKGNYCPNCGAKMVEPKE